MNIRQYYPQWSSWKEENYSLFGISSNLLQQIGRIGIIIAVFAAGVAGALLNPLSAVRIALGLIIVLAFLRYPYILLLAWALINAFIGSNLPIFSGNNVFTGLTVPTLLLMACVPARQTFKRMPALAFFLIYLLWVFASIGISAIGLSQFLTLWISYLNYIAVALLTIHVLTTRQRMLGLIDAILLVALFIALYGIYGYFTKQNGVLDTVTMQFRISSIFGSSPPSLALFLSIVIPLALYRAFTVRGFKLFFGLILILILLVALALTSTRSTFIIVPFSLIMMIILLPSHKIRIGLLSGISALAVLTGVLATLSNVSTFGRFSNQDIASLDGRLYLWRAVLDNFEPTQLLGNGLQAADLLLAKLHVSDSNQGTIATTPHNLFLEILYNHGIIGVTLLIVVFIALGAGLIPRIGKTTGEQRMVFVTALAVLVNVVFQSLDGNDFWIEGIIIYFWFVMALPFAQCWLSSKQPSESAEALFDHPTEPLMEAIRQGEYVHKSRQAK